MDKLLPSNQVKALSDYAFVTKYARYDHKKKRRETWDEAVDRVRDMHLHRYAAKGIEDEINWAFEMVRQKKVLPSMRSMQFGGEAILANDARMYNCAYTLADRQRFFSETLWMLLSGVGVGFSVQKQHVAKLPNLIDYQSPDEKEVITYMVADTIEGWADALDILMQTYYKGNPISGKEVFFDFSKIRRKGSWLKTSGGRAPGAKPLRVALKMIKKVLREAVEENQKKLTSIQVYDITMMAADAVLSGGIRRSATIAIFSHDDEEMMKAKTFSQKGRVLSDQRKDGSWETEFGRAINLTDTEGRQASNPDYVIPRAGDEVMVYWSNIMPWRARSNNSVALLRSECSRDQFDSIIENTRHFGEPGFVFLDNFDYGYNPCFSGDMRLLTKNGYRTLRELWEEGGFQEYNPNKTIDDFGTIEIVNSNGVVQATNVYRTSQDEGIYELQLQNGAKIRATAEHTFFVLEKRRCTIDGKRKIVWERIKKKLKELRPGDILPQNDSCAFGKISDSSLALLAGWVIGDGTINNVGNQQRDNVIAYDSDLSVTPVLRDALQNVYQNHNQSTNQNPRYRGIIQNHDSFGFDKQTMSSMVLGRRLREEGILVGQKHQIPEFIWKADRGTLSAFLRGLFSADGSVQLSESKKSISIRLWQANQKFLEEIQLLLSQFGITSSVHHRREARKVLMNDGKGGKKWYDSKSQYELIIGKRENLLKFQEIGFLQPEKSDRLSNWLDNHCGSGNSHNTYRVKIRSIKFVGREEVFCLTEPVDHEVCVQGALTSQCVEIALNPVCPATGETGWGVCNLTEINGGAIQNKEEWKEAVRAATIIGTLQAGYSWLHYLTDAARRTIRRERLLGVSITGWMENPDLLFQPDLQREMAEYAVEVNQEMADRIEIEHAARVTCTKPSGSSAIVLGTASGIHAHHAHRFFRRVQANNVESPLAYYKMHNPDSVEKSVWGSEDEVITFCVEVPENSIIKDDLSAIEFLKIVKSTWENWVKPGTARPDSSPGAVHNVSNTVHVDENEWDEVADFIFKYRDCFSGISLLPKIGDKLYHQAPNERIVSGDDIKKWNELVAKHKEVDWSSFSELEDYTSARHTVACANGVCEIL